MMISFKKKYENWDEDSEKKKKKRHRPFLFVPFLVPVRSFSLNFTV